MAEPIQPSDNAQATAISIAAAMVNTGEIWEALRNETDRPDKPADQAIARARLIGKVAAEILNPSETPKKL
jgi:hypothetical protein